MATDLINTGVRFPNSSEQTSALPVGCIALWQGTIASIPTGWQLCDGTNGTPDLRDRFIVGAGSTYAVGAVGGESTVTLSSPQLPEHTHPAPPATVGNNPAPHNHASTTSSTAAAHNHPINANVTSTNNANYNTGPGQFSSRSSTLTATQPAHPSSIGPAGAHNHTATVSLSNSPAVATTEHENRPPYYALAFIKEMSL